jgi:hypothetical protein
MSIPALFVSQQSRKAIGKLGVFVTGPAIAAAPPGQVWYAQSPGSGNFTIDVEGKSPLATINCEGPGGFLKATVTCPLGFHTVNLRQATRGTHDIYLTALRAFNSGIKELSVYNLGGCRWGSANFVVGTFPWNTLPAVAAISPNLVIFEAGIVNDWNDNIALSSVTSNMRTVIDALTSVNCDVILMSGAPSEPGVYATYATQAAYVENMRSLAYAANVPFIDVWGCGVAPGNGPRWPIRCIPPGPAMNSSRAVPDRRSETFRAQPRLAEAGITSVIARSSAAKQSISPCGKMDCFAEPVIGRAFARPVGSQ